MPISRFEEYKKYVLVASQEFFRVETLSSLVMLGCTAVALILANSPVAESYTRFWATPITVGIGEHSISKSLLLWINDGLMAIFFLLVGLEIKRETLVGELASFKRAALPIAAAVGGMVAPALIYLLFNAGQPSARGWGIPMATDIAFALSVLALLGNRIPHALKIFLSTLAIADDIGATLVIALFYTGQLVWLNLGIAGVLLASLFVLNALGVWRPFLYVLIGISLWIALLKSGVHATLAGIVLAFTIPASGRIDADLFLEKSHILLNRFRSSGSAGKHILTNEEQRAAILALESACRGALPPLSRIEHKLHPWVAFLIIPLFALANAGVDFRGSYSVSLVDPVLLGVFLGLVMGKQAGITLFAWLAVRCRMATLPSHLTWRHIYGTSWLAGIGFTMALFITNIAFLNMPNLLFQAKVGILLASVVSGAIGFLILRRLSAPPIPHP
ncbi:MAG: Na+/H+ antiporter NhaA [Nitrospirae bacterium]|nr:MAG: Na+/H+ antiporter NhaA [Nitrospirota bacterium]